MLPHPEYGCRVIYTKNGKSILGVVSNIAGHIISIKTDKDTSISDRNDDDTFQQVKYWREVPKVFKNPEALEKYIDYTPPSILFKSPNAVKLTVPLIRAMWWYINNTAFKGKLVEPRFLVTENHRTRGLFMYRGIDRMTLQVSNVIKNYVNIFNVVAHEMCHQYNFQVELASGKITDSDLNIKEGHGPVFERVADLVGKKLGIIIVRFYDGDVSSVVDGQKRDLNFKDAKKTTPYVFLIVNPEIGQFIGFRATNLLAAYKLQAKLSNMGIKRGWHSTLVFGGIGRFVEPKKSLNTKIDAPRFVGMTSDMVRYLASDYEEVDGLSSMKELFELNNMED